MSLVKYYDEILIFYSISIFINNFNKNKEIMLMIFKYATYT